MCTPRLCDRRAIFTAVLCGPRSISKNGDITKCGTAWGTKNGRAETKHTLPLDPAPGGPATSACDSARFCQRSSFDIAKDFRQIVFLYKNMLFRHAKLLSSCVEKSYRVSRPFPSPPDRIVMYFPLQINIFIVQYKELKSSFGNFYSTESDPPHKIMRYWIYYSIWLGFSFFLGL